MAIFEQAESRGMSIDLKTGRQTLKWWITQVTDDVAAYNLLVATAPASWNGYVHQNRSCEPIGPGLWDASVTYGPPEDPESQPKPNIGEFTFSFDTGGGKQKITSSESYTTYGRQDAFAPDLGGAINYNGKDVEGVDVVVPAFKYSLTKRVNGATLSESYMGMLAFLTGTVNEDQFLFCAPGENLFMGAGGSVKFGQDVETDLTLNFEASPNLQNLNIGEINVQNKAGWDYLWVYFRREDQASTHQTVAKPYAAYVHQVYRRAAHGPLLQ